MTASCDAHHLVFRHAQRRTAHEPVRMAFQRDDVAGLCILGCGQRHQQPRLAAIAVLHQRPRGQALGIRPFDRAHAPALRQCPVDRRRRARFAGILPIGVPALADVFFEGDGDRAAGRHFAVLGDQPRVHLGRGIDLRHRRCGERHKRHESQENCAERHHGRRYRDLSPGPPERHLGDMVDFRHQTGYALRITRS